MHSNSSAGLLMTTTLLLAAALWMPERAHAVLQADFEDLALPANAYENGAGLTHQGFWSGLGHFDNAYNAAWGSWSGIAYSSVNDTNTPGFGNQYAAAGGTGLGGTGAYAVVYDDSFDPDRDRVSFPLPVHPKRLWVNNTTYAALDMRDGSPYSKKFGGASGNDPDWFKLTIAGRDAAGTIVGSTNVYLADFRFADITNDYILTDWTPVDLTGIGVGIVSLHFSLASSDHGAFGMNTPAYFAFDNLEVIPQPACTTATLEDLGLPDGTSWNGSDLSGGFLSRLMHFSNSYNTAWFSWSGFAASSVNDTNTPGFGNQYAAFGGTGHGGTGAYAVVYDDPYLEADVIRFRLPVLPKGFYVNNTTYAALDMRDGSAYSKRFGGPSGNDEDWFKLTITGKDTRGETRGATSVYLADYRFADNTSDYILSDWTWVDLAPLGPGVASLHFSLSSSDNGAFGMNTPAYFAMDDLQVIASFSGPAADDHPLDGGIPGFVAPDGDGAPEGSNSVSNPAFAFWASTVLDYSPSAGVSPDFTNATRALGPASGTHDDVVALGELDQAALDLAVPPGTLTLGFGGVIRDEAGPDFVVFENGVPVGGGELFAEAAFVEVSSDGVNFARFPAVSLRETPVGGYDTQRSAERYNLIGKHGNGNGQSWGTPFDLGDLAADPLVKSGQLDLQAVSVVRIVDIPGNGSFTDSRTPPRPIYDPWVTFGSGGADVEAVGVLHAPGYHTVRTRVQGPGHITPYGMPGGQVAVADGASRAFAVTPRPGFHVIEVRLDGTSLGRTNAVVLTNIARSHSIEARFGSRLVVQSPHGAPQPPVGEFYGYGPMQADVAIETITMGATQVVCRGWSGQGSVPAAGETATTGAFALTNDSVIAWHWSTNYWLAVSAEGGGQVNRASDWQPRGADVPLTATPHPFHDWVGWLGDVADPAALSTVVTLSAPRTVTAVFHAELASNSVPIAWLEHHGLTNVPPDEAVFTDADDDGMQAWQEFQAGTDPNSAASVFAILALDDGGATNCVTWLGSDVGSVAPFEVQGRTNLWETWQTLGGAGRRSASGTNTLWIPSLGRHGYYRVIVGASP